MEIQVSLQFGRAEFCESHNHTHGMQLFSNIIFHLFNELLLHSVFKNGTVETLPTFFYMSALAGINHSAKSG